MGLLEDAIRDHLELKLRHGASQEEVLREEADALGPARREQLYPQQSEPQSSDDGAVAQEELAYEEPPAEPARPAEADLDFD